MIDKKASESRRKLLKSIAAGSGALIAGKNLPDSWSRPVVDSVLLPAHAVTSGRIYSDFLDLGSIDSDSDSMLAGVTNAFVLKAQAQPYNGAGCAVEMGGATFDVWLQYFQTFPSDILNEWAGTLDPDSPGKMTHTQTSCSGVTSLPDKDASITELTDNKISIALDGYGNFILNLSADCVEKILPPEC
jgi:hypothetical protein